MIDNDDWGRAVEQGLHDQVALLGEVRRLIDHRGRVDGWSPGR